MHVVPFAFLAVGAGLIGIGGSITGTLKRWLPMLPAGLTSIVWTFWSPAGRSTTKAVGKGADFKPWETALREMPDWLINPAPGPFDIHMLIAYSLLIIAALACGAGYRRRLNETETDSPADRLFPYFQRVAILAPLAFVGYFALPTSYQWIWPIAPRFALLGVFLLIPALPTARKLPAALIIGGLVVVSFQYFSFVDQNFRDFSQNEVGDLQPALDAIPPGQRVAGLIFDRNSRHARFSPFIHYVAYYQAQKGGAVMFTFADFPQSPFRFREDNRPPKVRPRWEWTPHRVDPKKELDWYNYVLVRGGPGKIARQKEAYEQVYEGEKWSVWHRQTP
jgi:hypothetical protein